MENTEQITTTNAMKEITPYVAGALALGALFLLAERFWSTQKPKSQTNLLGQNTPLARKWGNSTRDIVEQASWESFPASDAPAW